MNSSVHLAQQAKNGHLVYKVQGSRVSKKKESVIGYHNIILELPSIANIRIKVLLFKAIFENQY